MVKVLFLGQFVVFFKDRHEREYCLSRERVCWNKGRYLYERNDEMFIIMNVTNVG
jgi:hypothetical protein